MRYVDEALTMNQASPQSARLAALAMHALPPADCRWVLERLGPREREVVEPLLNELDELGMPKEASLAWRTEAAPADSVRAQADSVAAVPGLAALLAAAAADADAEPARLVALALQPHDQATRRAALDRMAATHRRPVQDALDMLGDADLTPRKLTQCLAAELAMLPTPAASASAAPPPVRTDLQHRVREAVRRCAVVLRGAARPKAWR